MVVRSRNEFKLSTVDESGSYDDSWIIVFDKSNILYIQGLSNFIK